MRATSLPRLTDNLFTRHIDCLFPSTAYSCYLAMFIFGFRRQETVLSSFSFLQRLTQPSAEFCYTPSTVRKVRPRPASSTIRFSAPVCLETTTEKCTSTARWTSLYATLRASLDRGQQHTAHMSVQTSMAPLVRLHDHVYLFRYMVEMHKQRKEKDSGLQPQESCRHFRGYRPTWRRQIQARSEHPNLLRLW